MAELDEIRSIHIVGAGGAGMSALAKLLIGRGYAVSGSDVRWGESLAVLSDMGAEVWAGHEPGRVAGHDLVVASSAVPDGDAELRAAGEQGIPVWRRPELLDALTAAIPTIGPTGTHGKTSSTAMMVSGVRAAGVDPSFVVGGELVAFGTNAAVGRDDLLVLEVDEAFGTFLHVHLSGLMVTNVEPEHLEHFGSEHALETAFAEVVRSVDGPVVVCVDDPGGARLANRTGVPGYGVDSGAAWRISDVAEGGGSSTFRLRGGGVDAPIEVPRSGMHMVRNAAGVVALLSELGLDPEAVARGIAGYKGVRRRFEHRGTVGEVMLIDDYAHHPTEVAATLREARSRTAGRLVAVFQPHLYSRTERFQREFGISLALADVVVVTDVYGSRETPIPGISGALVADAAIRAGAPVVRFVPHLGDVAPVVVDLAQPGDVVVIMGAGDVTTIFPALLAMLAAGG
jgi:UDP-N-acetylmuramate--alanine ligase